MNFIAYERRLALKALLCLVLVALLAAGRTWLWC